MFAKVEKRKVRGTDLSMAPGFAKIIRCCGQTTSDRDMSKPTARQRAARLAFWHGAVDPEPVDGGITNTNFLVRQAGQRYFVRIGDDIPHHGVFRFNELAASRAAAACGLSPEVLYTEPGVIVLAFIDGRTLTEADFQDPETVAAALALIGRVHQDVAAAFSGPAVLFWPPKVCADYVAIARSGNKPNTLRDALPRLETIADALTRQIGPMQPTLCHNDLLAGNFIDDGSRLWLIDWDYAGFNDALFDLANFASNNQLRDDQVVALLSAYYGIAPDSDQRRRFAAMACFSLLRETLWAAASEIHATLDIDFAAYGQENLDRLERAYERLQDVN